MQLAPWLHPTDVLGALQAGSHVGLSARQADQRDAEMQQQAELAAQHQREVAAEAAARLRENYDALAQARDLAFRKEDYETKRDAVKALQEKTNSDALAVYRTGLLNNSKSKISEKDALDKREEEQTSGLTSLLAGGEDLSSALLKFPYASKSLRGDLMRDLNSQRVTDRIDKRHQSAMDKGTETFDVPEVEASPAKPAYSGLFGTGLFSHPAIPAVPARPAMKVTRPVQASAIDALNAPVAQVPTPAVAPSDEGFRGGGAGSDWSGNGAPDEAESVRAAAVQKLKTAPSKRKEILKRLIDAGISVEGL